MVQEVFRATRWHLAAWGLAVQLGVLAPWSVAKLHAQPISEDGATDSATSADADSNGAATTFARSRTFDLADALKDIEISRVSFPELMDVAEQKAPRIRNARARLERGEARIEGADVLLPYEPNVRAGVERFPFGEFSYGEAKVGLTQRIQIAGQRGLRLEAARAFRDTLEQRLEEARWRVHAEVHRLYNRAVVERQRLRLAADVRAFAERLLEIAEKRVDHGAAPEMARHVAKAELARARQRFVEVQSNVVSTTRQLEEISGWEQSELPVPKTDLPDMRSSGEAKALLERAREHYPPVETQRYVLEAAKTERRLADRRAWPDPTFGLFYKRKAPETGDAVNGMIAQLALPLPLWNRNRAEREMKRAQVSVAKTALRTLQKRLKPRVEDAAREVSAAAERVEIYRDELLPAFRRQLGLLERGYREGEFDITEVTVARERLLENQRRALQAREDYVRAVGRLETLLGREFWRDQFDLSTSRGGSR